jgi:uncharacterized protein YjbI with pentapeptide repeats
MYKKITKEELDKTLKEHKAWFDSCSNSKKAYFLCADFTACGYLTCANFVFGDSKSDNVLCYDTSDIKFADLTDVDMQFAMLRFVEVPRTNALNVNLKNVDLTYDKLKKANLTSDGLKNVELIYKTFTKAGLKCFDHKSTVGYMSQLVNF